MKLILISNPTNISNEHTLLNTLFDEGLAYFHLRKPNFTQNEMEEYLQQLPSIYLNKVVLHSHNELVEKYNLKGMHKTATTISRVLETKYVSTSFHSLNEIRNYNDEYEYIFLSPVFNSISKEGYKSNFSKSDLKNFFQSTSTCYHTSQNEFRTSWGEVIALGGINQRNAEEALDMGFSGIAVLGAIWLSDNPIKAFKDISNTVKQYVTQHA